MSYVCWYVVQLKGLFQILFWLRITFLDYPDISTTWPALQPILYWTSTYDGYPLEFNDRALSSVKSFFIVWWVTVVKSHKSPLTPLRPRHNGRHFPDDIFKCIFLNENVYISIKISLKFASRGEINNNPALVKIMALVPTRRQAIIWKKMMVSLLLHMSVTRPQWVLS